MGNVPGAQGLVRRSMQQLLYQLLPVCLDTVMDPLLYFDVPKRAVRLAGKEVSIGPVVLVGRAGPLTVGPGMCLVSTHNRHSHCTA